MGNGAPKQRRDRLVVATRNGGKLHELRSLLDALPIDVQSVAEVTPDAPEVVEDGATFADNAIKKARAVAERTGMLTVADDSGLEVDVLGGRPGVYSARFAHPRASDAENNAALLAAVETFGEGARAGAWAARFRCVLALVDPFTAGSGARLVEGVCEGAITRSPRGAGGFGYDPLFVVAGTNRTMAELDLDEKNRVSHRARALARLRPILEEVLRERAAQAAFR